MKYILSFLLLTCLGLTATAQQLPPYDRTTTNQVLADRATWSRYFMALPKGAAPNFPSYVPDSLKCGALFYRTTDTCLYQYNCIANKWVKFGSLAKNNAYADSLKNQLLNGNNKYTGTDTTTGNNVHTGTEKFSGPLTAFNAISLNADTAYSGYSIASRFLYGAGDSNMRLSGVSGVFTMWFPELAAELNVTPSVVAADSRTLQQITGGDNSVYTNMTSLSAYVNALTTPAYIIDAGLNDIKTARYTVAAFTTQYGAIIDYLTGTKGWPASRIYIASPHYMDYGAVAMGYSMDYDKATFNQRQLDYRTAVIALTVAKGVNFVDLYTISKNWFNTTGIGGLIYNDGLHWSPAYGTPLLVNFWRSVLPAEFYDTGKIKQTTRGTLNPDYVIVNKALEVQGNTAFRRASIKNLILQTDPTSTWARTDSTELATASGWTVGAGWTGTTIPPGFTHTSGSGVDSLRLPITSTVNNVYQVSVRTTGRTTGTFSFSFGGETFTSGTGANATNTFYPKAENTKGFIFNPSNTYNGTVDSVSIRRVLPSAAVLNVTAQTGAGVAYQQMHASKSSTSLFWGTSSGRYTTSTSANGNSVGFGPSSLQYLSGGTGETAVGVSALPDLSLGINNTAVGFGAGTGISWGSYNTIIGRISTGLSKGLSNQVIVGDGNNNQAISINTLTDRGQRRFLATPTGATGAFTSRAIDVLDLPTSIPGANLLLSPASASLTTNGSTTSFNVTYTTPGYTPTQVLWMPSSAIGSGGWYITAITSTGFTVNYVTAPATGTATAKYTLIK